MLGANLGSVLYGDVSVMLATNGTIGKITNGTIGRTPNGAKIISFSTELFLKNLVNL